VRNVARDRASRPEAKPLRLFVAVDVPRAVKDALAEAAAQFRDRIPGARWTRSDGWHVTLKFLGTTWPRLVDPVRRAVTESAARAAPFETRLTEFGVFPSRRRARVVWVGLSDPEGRCAALAASLDDALAEDFDLLGEREAKNQYVLEMGDKLPRTFDLLKRVTQRVPGCMSEVYVVPRKGPGGSVEFIADANADIVRGLIAILQKLFSGQRAAEVVAFDVEAFFRRIELDQFITTQRRNGLAGMVQRIQSFAAEVAGPKQRA